MSPKEKIDVLISLNTQLTNREKPTVLREALDTTQRIRHQRDRDAVLEQLAALLAEAGLPEEALAVAPGIHDEDARNVSLAGLGQAEEALAVARGIHNEPTRVRALARAWPGRRRRFGGRA